MSEPDDRLVGFFQKLVSRPIAVLMVVTALLGASAIAALRIPIELLPSGFAMSSISVSTSWPGANPVEVEQKLVRPLEEEFQTIRGVQRITARAFEGGCWVNLSFSGSFDMDQAYAEVADRLERARPRLPREADRVVARRFTADDQPVLWCGVLYSDEMAEEAQELVGDVLIPRLESVDGVASADAMGLMPRSVRILLDEDLVRANRVDIGALLGQLQADNLSAPVGDLDEAGSRYIVRIDGRFDSLEEIEDFPVREGLRIRDIGRVILVHSAPEYLFKVDGQYAMGLSVSKETAANSFEVCSELQRMFEEELPDDPVLGGLDYSVFWSQGDTIRDSLVGLVEDAAIGGAIASAVLFLFLWRLRFTFLIALSIPFSVLATLAYLYFSGGTFNLFSMMGITISIGMLVDNSVVIVESIFHRRERGEALSKACTRGPADMMLAVITATATTIVVFLPLIFMTEDRNARTFTTSIGIPLCISLAAALFLAILVVPVASRFLVRDRADGAATRPAQARAHRVIGFLTGWLPRLVGWSLHNRFRAAMLALLFLASGKLASSDNEISGDLGGGGQIQIDFEFGANTTLWEAEEALMPLEQALLADDFQRAAEAIGGETTLGIGFNRGDGDINLWFERPISPEETDALRDLVKEHAPKHPAYQIKFEEKFSEESQTEDQWDRLLISGPESLVVADLAEQVRRAARGLGHWETVAEDEDPAREMLVTLDRERLLRAGTNSRNVLGVIEWGLRGLMISRFETERGDVPIIMEFDEEADPDRARLRELGVAGTATGSSLPLSAFAGFQDRRGPSSIYRRDARTMEVVGLKPVGKDLRKRAANLTALMAGIDMPEGYRWEQSGGMRDFEQDMEELMSAFTLAVALVFLLMGLLFESLILPFSVLITIAFAVVGAQWAFKLSGTPIDIVGMIGMIVLAGVVVNNGIVLVDRIIRLRRGGASRDEAIVQGVRDRLRPVLMTALTTIAGLLPIAVAVPGGSGISFQGLAIGVSGGLAFSTFFTLWVVPLTYSLLEDLGHVLNTETVGRLVSRLPRLRRRAEA